MLGHLILYSYWRSSAAYRVRIALNLKHLTYELVPVHLLRKGGEHRSKEFMELNPQGLVPVLTDGGRVMRQSGAIIEYLSVYERRLPDVGPETLADLESRWRQGEINVVTVMSVQSLINLAEILPAWCAAQLASTLLVTPSGRVLKEALDRYPASRPTLAPGPGADEMVKAIIAIQSTNSGMAP